MNAALRQTLSALSVVAVVALALGGAALTALSLWDRQAEVALLQYQADALKAHEKRLAPLRGRDLSASPLFEAKTITLAGAALQQRFEAAIVAARGRLVSSKVDVAPRNDERRISLSGELTITEDDLQALLFDVETGRPYLFVDALEARAPEAGSEPSHSALRVSMTVSGQWSGAK